MAASRSSKRVGCFEETHKHGGPAYDAAAVLFCVVGVAAVLLASPSAWAIEPPNERASDSAVVEYQRAHIRFRGSGKATGDVQRLKGAVQFRDLFGGPAFLDVEGRFDAERRLPYDLIHAGGHVGIGRVLDEHTDALLRYRFDNYNVYDTGNNMDPSFRAVEGGRHVTALHAGLLRDTRDDRDFPTAGLKASVGSEFALQALGGDYNFWRAEGTCAIYGRPFRGRPIPPPINEMSWKAGSRRGGAGTIVDELVLVEHARVGWVTDFHGGKDVPFYERYFIGGTSTVRGHRSRWLTPRGLEQQFVGGELVLVNNLEARLPIFQEAFQRRLSIATFLDAGRAFRRFSDVGDFGYGAGAGVRYVVDLLGIHGVVRTDYAASFDDEGDDATSRLHVSFGMPF